MRVFLYIFAVLGVLLALALIDRVERRKKFPADTGD